MSAKLMTPDKYSWLHMPGGVRTTQQQQKVQRTIPATSLCSSPAFGMLMSCTTAAAAHTQQHYHYVTKLNGYVTKVGGYATTLQHHAKAIKCHHVPRARG
jgi:hypothetical protein